MEQDKIQEIYNRFLIKKKYALGGDVVGHFTLEDVDIIMKGLASLGATEELGLKALENLQKQSDNI